MNIILVSEKLAKARTFTLGLPQLALFGLGMMFSLVALAAAGMMPALRSSAQVAAVDLSLSTSLSPGSQMAADETVDVTFVVTNNGPADAPPGAFDQSDVEMRQDVLVYSTPPLAEGIEVTGPIEAKLYVSSSAKDTDFTVKLIDVYPNGAAYNVQEGILRARYREGWGRQVLMTPGEVYPITVNVHATSNYFGPGHRIRVEVSSSNFPRFDRNLNTGGNNSRDSVFVVARNTVFHSARYPSHLVLPVVR